MNPMYTFSIMRFCGLTLKRILWMLTAAAVALTSGLVGVLFCFPSLIPGHNV